MLPELSLTTNLAIFSVAAALIATAGIALTRRADILADRTGLGEALTGAIFLGVTTSLSGTVTSVTAAAAGNVALSVGNAIGGIAAQTAFLAIADLFYRRANLEHAAASATNLSQASVLVVLLAIPLIAASSPEIALVGVHPASVLLVLVYLAAVRMSAGIRLRPMWFPRRTQETRKDKPEHGGAPTFSNAALAFQFGILAAIVAIAGWAVAETAAQISAHTGLSQSVVGALFAAITTSLPELITTVSAIRRGALQLAVGGIIGGNTFDVLFLALSDAAYREGSIYHAFGEREVFLLALAMLMTGVLLVGLLRREPHGPAGIGTESVLLLAIYLVAVAIQIAVG